MKKAVVKFFTCLIGRVKLRIVFMSYMVFPRQIVGDLECFMMVSVPSVLSLPVYIISIQRV